MVGLNVRASRRRALEDGQWVAARALTEGAPPTRDRVAAALGCNVSSLHVRARAEGWRPVNFRPVPTKEAWEEFMRVAHAGAALDDAVRPLAVGGAAGVAVGAVAGRSGAEAISEEQGGEDAGVAGAGGAEPDVAGQEGAGPAEAGQVEAGQAAACEWADRLDVAAVAAGLAARVDAGIEDEAGGADADAEADGDDPKKILARGARFLSRRLSRLMRLAERGGAISKQEIDGLTALSRMMERWETLAKERASKDETDRDGKITEALRKIDRRILTLARAEAERLVAAGGAEGDRGRDQ